MKLRDLSGKLQLMLLGERGALHPQGTNEHGAVQILLRLKLKLL